jgi:uncharacterized membrane protein
MKKAILLVLSIAGFFDASYLTILHYQNTIPPCTIANGCEKVLTSDFATIFGIPVALIGSIYFLVLIFLLLLNKNYLFKYFKILTAMGVLVSIYFFSTQAFIIKAFCQYCLLSSLIILLIFTVTFFYREKSNKSS